LIAPLRVVAGKGAALGRQLLDARAAIGLSLLDRRTVYRLLLEARAAVGLRLLEARTAIDLRLPLLVARGLPLGGHGALAVDAILVVDGASAFDALHPGSVLRRSAVACLLDPASLLDAGALLERPTGLARLDGASAPFGGLLARHHARRPVALFDPFRRCCGRSRLSNCGWKARSVRCGRSCFTRARGLDTFGLLAAVAPAGLRPRFLLFALASAALGRSRRGHSHGCNRGDQ
jgi:hypothetical protein